jgi:hypothetical protein
VVADAFFQVKDLVWTLVGAILGGALGWGISWRFYQRGRRDIRRDLQEAVADDAGRARRSAQRVAEQLWQALISPSQTGVDQARNELQAGRGELVLTDQEVLVDFADGVIDNVSSWLEAGAPAEGREAVAAEIRDLYRSAGRDPAGLAPALSS